jgi:hypothetical protein
MGRNTPKIYTQVVSMKLSVEQEQWLLRKAASQTNKLGREVTKTMVMRALIQQQMDKDLDLEKVWDDSIQVSGTV